MRKLEIINKVSSQTGIDKSDVQETIEATLITIKEALKEGESVYIRGFGSFTNNIIHIILLPLLIYMLR